MFETYAVLALAVGAGLIAAAFVWLIVRAFRVRRAWGLGCLLFPPTLVAFVPLYLRRLRGPLVVLAVGIVIVGATFGVNRYFARHIALGPREKQVDGELHITLTGWDRSDYSVLQAHPQTAVLQMANPDVTDETLDYLAGMTHLRELDLNGTKVTDTGLETLSRLNSLEILRLRGTSVSDEGFRTFLRDKPSLVELDARDTQIASRTLREWKAENKVRRKYLR